MGYNIYTDPKWRNFMIRLLVISIMTILAGILLFLIGMFFGKIGCMVFICILAAGGFVYMVAGLRKRMDIIKNGIPVQAHLKQDRSFSILAKPKANYVYTDESGKTYEFKKEFTIMDPKLYAMPEITVYYKPDAPHASAHRSCIGMRIIYLICYIVLVTLVISCFAVVMFF